NLVLDAQAVFPVNSGHRHKHARKAEAARVKLMNVVEATINIDDAPQTVIAVTPRSRCGQQKVQTHGFLCGSPDCRLFEYIEPTNSGPYCSNIHRREGFCQLPQEPDRRAVFWVRRNRLECLLDNEGAFTRGAVRIAPRS